MLGLERLERLYTPFCGLVEKIDYTNDVNEGAEHTEQSRRACRKAFTIIQPRQHDTHDERDDLEANLRPVDGDEQVLVVVLAHYAVSG